MIIYSHRYRPTGRDTLPAGVHFEYVEVPYHLAHVWPDLPCTSRRYGAFTTSRPLTEEELRAYEIDTIGDMAQPKVCERCHKHVNDPCTDDDEQLFCRRISSSERDKCSARSKDIHWRDQDCPARATEVFNGKRYCYTHARLMRRT